MNLQGIILGILLYISSIQAVPAPLIVTLWQTTTISPTQTTSSPSINTGIVSKTQAVVSQTSGSSSSSSTSSSQGNFWSRLFSSEGSSLRSWLSNILGSNGSTTSSISSTSALSSSSVQAYPSLSTSSETVQEIYTSEVRYNYGSESSTTQSWPNAQTSSASTSSENVESTGTSTETSSSGLDESFATSILNAHNQARAKHSVGSLSWDSDAYNYAKQVADNYDCSGVLTHTHGNFGENLACGFQSGVAAFNAWYEEGDNFDYASANTYNHFTQIVWKDTTGLGCAYKDCSSNNWGLYVVCEYSPPGNIVGKESQNVLQ